MFFGSQAKGETVRQPIATLFNEDDFTVTADQISESYTVANIASSVDLPSTSSISENYVTLNSFYESTGSVAKNTSNTSSASSVIDKPTVIDTSNLARGVVSYVVKEGDSLDSLAKKYKVTKDQIRWSNGMKTEDVTVGSTLYIPSVSGIVYKVGSGDTIDGLAQKYKSSADLIVSYNDLEEDKALSDNTLILLPNGELPETERPEYVAPAPVTRRRSSSSSSRSYSNSYTYSRDVGNRRGMTEIGSYSYWSQEYNNTRGWGNPGAFGNCTWFAWYWRRKNMPSNYWLPGGAIGNARSWTSTLGGSFKIGRTPAYGAVFQSMSGYYGHVGVVVGVKAGESITIQEMNYSGPNGKFNHVYQSTLSWSDALNFNYIYERR
ncbi:LysM peptidoglycan-binding domain-containing protein [Candidatus Saccharibacteria bacterium]|nr:LysM peptidoglycan-binding domain-containing protein [Candidatus Saccharibacteria bacterium]